MYICFSYPTSCIRVGHSSYCHRDGRKRSSLSRENKALPPKLGSTDTRPLGPACGQRVSSGLRKSTSAEPTPYTSSACDRASLARPGRDPGHVKETGNIRNQVQPGGVLLQPIPGTKEGWRPEARNKPKTLELLHRSRALQNGGHPHAERPPKRRRLASQSGSKGCIFHDSNRRVGPEISPIPLGQQVYQFNCLLFGLSCAPCVFTKTLKPIAAQLRQLGVRLIIYIDDILIMAESETLVRDHVKGLIFLLENLGFVVNHPKSQVTPTQEIDFLGFTINTRSQELRLPGDKIKKVQAEARKLLKAPQVSALDLSRFLGKLNAATRAILPAPLFYRELQGYLNRTLAKLLGHSNTASRGQRRAPVVDGPLHKLEWQKPNPGKTLSHPGNRCVPDRMGSYLQGNEDRRSMVETRENLAHQLPGVTRSHPSNQMLCQGHEGHHHTPHDGQSHSSCVCQQIGERHHPHSTTPSRNTEHNRGQRVPSDEGQSRLDAQSCSVQGNSGAVRPTGSGPVCIQIVCATPNLLQLETSPRGSGSGRIHPGLEQPEGVCEPTMGTPEQSASPNEATGGGPDPDGLSLEGPDVVPCSAGNANGLPSPNPSP